MAHDVFISHSVKDKAVADAIVARLEAESVTCWVAPRDVVPGADWGESIINAIESSRIMILIFSQSANTSTQIKREVERAVNKGVYIIPFRVDDIPPARSLEYFISTSQWMDAFSPPLERHLDNLAKTVKSVLQSPPLPGASVPVQSERKSPIVTAQIPRPSSRKAIPIAVAIVALMIVGGVGWYLGHKRETLYVTPAGRSTTETAPSKSASKQTTKHPQEADRSTAPANGATPQTPPISSALVAKALNPS
jgi:TIR domain